MKRFPCITVLLALLAFVKAELDLEGHTRLNGDERKALELLKEAIYPRITEDFMKNDLYLLRFLQARGFDVDQAELMMRNVRNFYIHIQWRKENAMEEAKKEEWTDMEKSFPYKIQGKDKDGRPILLMDFKKWDIAKSNSDPEKHKKLVRYFNKMTDEALDKVMQEQQAGKNVTQFLWLIDMDGVNTMDHINLASASFYWDVVNSYELNNPKLATKIMLLNSPTIFHNLVIPTMRPLMSQDSDKAFDDYKDKEVWKPLLDNLVDESQLPSEYGGTKGKPRKGGLGLLVGAFQKQPDGSWKQTRGRK